MAKDDVMKKIDAKREVRRTTKRTTVLVLLLAFSGFAPAAIAGQPLPKGAEVTTVRVAPSSRAGFDWRANHRQTATNIAVQQATLLKARKIVSRGATWICSPAGSNRRSTCQKA
jgi:hypothetical protein